MFVTPYIFSWSSQLLPIFASNINGTLKSIYHFSLIKGIKLGLELKLLNLNIYSASQLIVRQINGKYQVKNDRMKLLHNEVISLLQKFETWSLSHVLRDKNKVADKLANEGRKKS